MSEKYEDMRWVFLKPVPTWYSGLEPVYTPKLTPRVRPRVAWARRRV